MIAAHLLHPARTLARFGRMARGLVRPGPATACRRGAVSLEGVDRRTLSDIGIGRGAIVSLTREVALDQLRRPPHL